jgi:hypothetical protein
MVQHQWLRWLSNTSVKQQDDYSSLRSLKTLQLPVSKRETNKFDPGESLSGKPAKFEKHPVSLARTAGKTPNVATRTLQLRDETASSSVAPPSLSLWEARSPKFEATPDG